MAHRITHGYKQFRDNDLISFGYGVTGKMSGNAHFTDAPAALAELEKVLPEYQEVNYRSRNGDEVMRLKRKALRVKTVDLLAELAEYVTGKAGGDPVILVSGGFERNRARGTKPIPPIKDLKVTIDRPGEAVTSVKRVAGAKAYAHQYTNDPLTSESVWVSKVSTEPSYTFTGLESKEKYWFQVIAFGVNDQQSASTSVSRVIQ
ncbi:hypothetical protein [Longitalea arenae]|uniref:hypothetical protein n=1 Tax=Longitalea arenae TaxID=2812558 RepID=UPI0019672D77|nr:hypothetical protein [Longitalea arenae]